MNRGEVVEVDWQYSDLSGSKVRPTVVVQPDFLNGLIADTVLIQATGSRIGIPGTEVLLDPAVEVASGLSKVCVANRMNLLTIDQTAMLGTIGVPSDAAMRQIE